MAWQKIDEDTLTANGSTMTVSGDIKKFNETLCHSLPNGGIENLVRYGNTTIDTGSNYAQRNMENGGSELTSINQASHQVSDGGGAEDRFFECVFCNIGTEEKLCIYHWISAKAAGAGTVPARLETVGKYVNTSQVDIADTTEARAGNYLTDSNLSWLGTD